MKPGIYLRVALDDMARCCQLTLLNAQGKGGGGLALLYFESARKNIATARLEAKP